MGRYQNSIAITHSSPMTSLPLPKKKKKKGGRERRR